MQYENPHLDERLNPNVAHEPPSRELWRMVGWSLALLAVLWLIIRLLVFSLPYWISIENEQKWLAPVLSALTENMRKDAALQDLADELALGMQLPKGSVEVSIDHSSVPNAFATLGGQVVLMSGLLQCLPTEEAVAAVLAHEIAHIAHRDPLRSASHGVLLGLASSIVFGNVSGLAAVNQLASLRYSRDLEEAADSAAVHALAARYRHAGGMVQLFEVLSKAETAHEHAEGNAGRFRWRWLSSHPDTAERVVTVRRLAARHQYALQSPGRPNRWRDSGDEAGCDLGRNR
ncbi:MAG: M48 family metallopeptidase [Lautropia sp.]|nr:M48 family metallopeptidase [Lautropia sp.]